MSDSNLSFNDLTRFRLDEINKIKDYFNLEIKERNETTKKLVNILFYSTMLTKFSLHCLHHLVH